MDFFLSGDAALDPSSDIDILRPDVAFDMSGGTDLQIPFQVAFSFNRSIDLTVFLSRDVTHNVQALAEIGISFLDGRPFNP